MTETSHGNMPDEGYDGAELRRISAEGVADDVARMQDASRMGPLGDRRLPMGSPASGNPWRSMDETPQDTWVVVRGVDGVERSCFNHKVYSNPGETLDNPSFTMPREWRLPGA